MLPSPYKAVIVIVNSIGTLMNVDLDGNWLFIAHWEAMYHLDIDKQEFCIYKYRNIFNNYGSKMWDSIVFNIFDSFGGLVMVIWEGRCVTYRTVFWSIIKMWMQLRDVPTTSIGTSKWYCYLYGKIAWDLIKVHF